MPGKPVPLPGNVDGICIDVIGGVCVCDGGGVVNLVNQRLAETPAM